LARRRRKRSRGTEIRRGAAAGAAGRYEVSITPWAVTRVLLIVTLGLLACHAGLSLYHYRVAKVHWLVRQLFDVDQENNLPTWFSGFLLLLTSGFLWFCARQKRADGDRWSRYWQVLAWGFLLMSVDEIAGIHESINSAIVITWAIPGGIGALVIGLAYVPFLLHLPRRTALRFALAGAIYLTGAAGIEIVGNSLVGQRLQDTLEYNLWTLAEEGMEMLGVVFFLHTLLCYMRGSDTGTVRASLELD
jgi:hypothetical protein